MAGIRTWYLWGVITQPATGGRPPCASCGRQKREKGAACPFSEALSFVPSCNPNENGEKLNFVKPSLEVFFGVGLDFQTSELVTGFCLVSGNRF